MDTLKFKAPASGEIEITTDSETGAIYVYLDPVVQKNVGTIAITSSISPVMNLDFDKDGFVVGIEFLPSS